VSAAVHSLLGVRRGGQEKVPFKALGLAEHPGLGEESGAPDMLCCRGPTPVTAAGGFAPGAGQCRLLMNIVCSSLSYCKLPSAGMKQHFRL